MAATRHQEVSDSMAIISDEMRVMKNQIDNHTRMLRMLQLLEETSKEQVRKSLEQEEKLTMIQEGMAEQTIRMDSFQKSINNLQNQLEGTTNQIASMFQTINSLAVSVGEIVKKLDIRERKQPVGSGSNVTGTKNLPPTQLVFDPGEQRSPVGDRIEPRNGIKIPKFDFPTYEGKNDPGEWIFKATKYFDLHRVPNNQRVDIASIYMKGRACIWLQGYLRVNPNAEWEALTNALCMRFGNMNDILTMSEFSKIQQKGSVEEYYDKFEELRDVVMKCMPQASEQYYVSVFLSGLKTEIQPLMRMFQLPLTLMEAYEKARSIQESLALQQKPYKTVAKTSGQLGSWKSKDYSDQKNKTSAIPAGGFQKLTTAELNERRQKGLCFKCGGKFTPDHICPKKQLNLIITAELDATESEGEDLVVDEENGEELNSPIGEEVQILVNKLSGMSSLNAIRLEGRLKNKKIVLLVDPGATGSFTDSGLVEEMKIQKKLLP